LPKPLYPFVSLDSIKQLKTLSLFIVINENVKQAVYENEKNEDRWSLLCQLNMQIAVRICVEWKMSYDFELFSTEVNTDAKFLRIAVWCIRHC
jgi:hypothetical protein